MQEEFREAYRSLQAVLFMPHKETPWRLFFMPQKFFEEPKGFYVQVDVIAPDSKALKKWDGYVRSRLRMMVKNMEDSVNARPLPKALDSPRTPDDILSPYVKCYFLCITKRTPQVRMCG